MISGKQIDNHLGDQIHKCDVTSCNPIVNDLAHQLRSNDPTLTYLSFRRLPLWTVSWSDMMCLLSALEHNTVVKTLDLWLPGKDTAPSSNKDSDINYSILSRILEQNKTLQRLVVTSWSSDSDYAAWQALVEGLRRNVSIQSVELGDAVHETSSSTDYQDVVMIHCDEQEDSKFGNDELGDLEMIMVSGKLKALTLKGLTLSPTAAERLANGISQSSSLFMLECMQVSMDRGSWGTVLESCRNGTLSEIHIAQCDLGFSATTMISCAQPSDEHPLSALLRKNSSLRVLRVISSQFGVAELRAVTDAGQLCLKQLELRDHELTGCGGLLAHIAQQASSLEHLSLSDTGLGNGDLIELCRGLYLHASLSSLNIQNNNFCSVLAAQMLAHTISSLTRIESLDISECPWGDEGVSVLRTTIASHTSLRKLHLADIRMTDCGFVDLCSSLLNNASLGVLDVSRNRLGTSGMHAVADLLSRSKTTIYDLNLSNCHLTDHGVETLGRSLSSAKSLVRLSLASNSAGNDACRAIASSLPHSSLACLELQFNRFDEEGLGHLVEALQHSVDLHDLFVWNACVFTGGVVSKQQQSKLQFLSEAMLHWLRLNRAGRGVIRNYSNLLWEILPIILHRAGQLYGPDALFHMLQARPELVLQSKR